MPTGLIDTERVRGMMGSGDADSVRRRHCLHYSSEVAERLIKEFFSPQRLDPNAIAETFLNLAQQPRSCWTHGAHASYSLCASPSVDWTLTRYSLMRAQRSTCAHLQKSGKRSSAAGSGSFGFAPPNSTINVIPRLFNLCKRCSNPRPSANVSFFRWTTGQFFQPPD